jgi:hypothetical protein
LFTIGNVSTGGLMDLPEEAKMGAAEGSDVGVNE